MANGLVIHVEVGERKHTEMLAQDRISIGLSDDCDLRLQLDGFPAGAADAPFLELARTNGHYRVGDFNRSLGITHNGEPLVYGSPIADGDELRLAQSNLALQFFPIRDLPAIVAPPRRPNVVAPFIENAAIEAAATARRDDAKVFLREFTRELVREINLSTKIITLLIVVALVGGMLYLGFAGYKELRRSRDLINQQNEQMARLRESMDETSDQFAQVDKTNKDIINSLSLAPKVRSEYGNGVCLIAGSYSLVEAGTGRPLRYPEFQTTEDGTTLQNGEDQPILTPDGRGAPYINDFVGTGFHVGDGYIVTNRHIALEPWKADERVQSLSASVNGQFRLTRLVAFFPGRRQPYVLRFRQSSTRDDLAVVVIDGKEVATDIPVLPLDKDYNAVMVGRAVVMMGYPKGADRLLATLPEAESRNLQQRYGASLESLLMMLAERNFIKPLTTQGHITDLEEHRIGYDARTAEGGSGAPLFGQSGRVIGVNFAMYTDMADANFAVPVRYAITLLQRAGWKSNEPTAATADANGNTNATPKDARTPSTAANNQDSKPKSTDSKVNR